MGQSAGAGSPVHFVCPVARRNRIGTWGGGNVPPYPPGHDTITLTGRTRPYESKSYSALGQRSTHVAREYICSCGHQGWSNHVDLERMEKYMEAKAKPEATHIRCFECSALTALEPGDTQEDTPCPDCEDEGRDPYCTEALALIPCPNGVTAADFTLGVGFAEGKSCDDETHHPRTGMHEIEIEG